MKANEIVRKYPSVKVSTLFKTPLRGIQKEWVRQFIAASKDSATYVIRGASDFADRLYKEFPNAKIFLSIIQDKTYWVDLTEHWYLVTDASQSFVLALIRYYKNAVNSTLRELYIPKVGTERYSVAKDDKVYYDVMPLSKRDGDTSYFKFILYECNRDDEATANETRSWLYRNKMAGLRYRFDENGDLVSYS